MKRVVCLVEDLEHHGHHESHPKKAKENTTIQTMHRNTIWYRSLLDAEKTCLKQDKLKKIHYKFNDGREMVEEYNVDTQVMCRRAWKVKGKLGGEGKWEVEVGDKMPDAMPNNDFAFNNDILTDFIEANDQPSVTKRNTRVNLEWRIRNLPYPIETYSINANNDEKCIIVRTSNKKYYKRLQVPELERLNIPFDQMNLQCAHQYNTLIITYKKPQQLLEMDKDWYEELKNVKAAKDIPNDCKTQ